MPSIPPQVLPPRCSSRILHPPSYLKDFHCHLVSHNSSFRFPQSSLYPLSNYVSYQHLNPSYNNLFVMSLPILSLNFSIKLLSILNGGLLHRMNLHLWNSIRPSLLSLYLMVNMPLGANWYIRSNTILMVQLKGIKLV